MTRNVLYCMKSEQVKIDELNEDVELLLKYLADVHEAVERLY